MITIVTNTTSVIELTAYPFTGTVSRRGKEIPVLEIPCAPSMTIESINEMFRDEASMVSMILMDQGTEIRRYTDWTQMMEISLVPEDVDDDGNVTPSYYVVKMGQKLKYDEEMLQMKQSMSELRKANEEVVKEKKVQDTKIKELAEAAQTISDTIENIQESMKPVDPNTLDLPELKTYLISQSKQALSSYLASNPIPSSAHGGVQKLYSITAEKQSYLMAMILMTANMEEARLSGMKQYYDTQWTGDRNAVPFDAFVVGVDNGSIATPGVTFNKYQASWNAVGEPCSYDWTLSELKQLAAEIEAVVRPLVSKQQTMEVEIKAAATKEEARAVNLSFTPATKIRAH